jgi:hypothetical protein
LRLFKRSISALICSSSFSAFCSERTARVRIWRGSAAFGLFA